MFRSRCYKHTPAPHESKSRHTRTYHGGNINCLDEAFSSAVEEEHQNCVHAHKLGIYNQRSNTNRKVSGA